MAPIQVKIKHAGKVHDVPLDPDLPPTAFKDAVYQRTGVPPERMKVMVKGGVLKDDTDWRKVAPKEGQTFMVIGAAGELPKPPSTPTVFLEDMDDSELAQALALPIGLVNLGNTCYMNATIQSMRAIPELQSALDADAPSGLPSSLKTLYSNMKSTIDAVTPAPFLNALRTAFPQFAEMARGGGAIKSFGGAMYAQQDAEECWTQITHALKDVPGLPDPANRKFVDQFMTGEVTRVLKCAEAPDEPPSTTIERVLKLECNITVNTNFMHGGILNALDTELTKTSPSLGREATYTSTSRLSRLPSYLTVHMVRFAWRQDIGKKTKIMRRVKFPLEYDALDIATDTLREKLLPVSRRLKELEKERGERGKVRKRTKTVQPAPRDGDVEMRDAPPSDATDAPEPEAKTESVELQDEDVYRAKERAELEALVHPDIKADVGASVSGLYELIAIVTHKGAAADAGHYMAYVKKRAFHPIAHAAPSAGAGAGEGASAGEGSRAAVTSPEQRRGIDEDDEDWYKFDDAKVSVFPADKIPTLEGGGEDSSAYVLLYRAKPLA